jgi:hypothetical protein
MILKSTIAIFIVSMFFIANLNAQDNIEYSGQVNIISSAVPFLNFTPDSRSGAMGDAGVALSPDVNSQHWNPAKFAFTQGSAGVALSYTPWLRNLVPDMNMLYLTGFYRLDKMQVISTSLRYFSLGEIFFRDYADDLPVRVNPYEMAFDIAYSRVLSDHFSGAVAFRYIRSDLYSSFSGDENLQAGNAFAADVAFYYKTTADLFGQNSEISSGINISNIGSKLSYDGNNTKQFIPTNMRLGVAVSTDLDAYNSFTFTVDLNKLLIPTPGRNTQDENDYSRENQDLSPIKAMFQSFSDAPNGAKEEFQEITYNVGAEYWYDKQFAVRAGYFHEHENKGNRKYITAGLGIKFNMLTLDASYLVPVVQNNPLANTIRFTLGFDLDGLMR